MKPIVVKSYSIKEKQLSIFSDKKNLNTIKHSHTIFPEILNYKINSNKIIKTLQNKTREIKNFQISSISRSLKNVALSSELYNNYVDSHPSLPKTRSLKTFRNDKNFF